MDSRNYTLLLTTDGPMPQTVGRLLANLRSELLTFTYPQAGDGPLQALLRASTDPQVAAALVRHALDPLGRGVLAARLIHDTYTGPDAGAYAGQDLYCRRRPAGCPLPPHDGPCALPHPSAARHTLVHLTLLGGLGPYRVTIIGYQEPGMVHPARISRSELLRLSDDLLAAGRKPQWHLADDDTAVIVTPSADGTAETMRLDRDGDGLYLLPSGWAEQIRPIRTRPAYHGLTYRRAHVRRPDLTDGYPCLLIDPDQRGVVPWLSRDTLLQIADDLDETNEHYDGGGGDTIVMTDPDAVVFRVDHNLREAGPITILRPNSFGLYAAGRTRTSWTARLAAEPPLTIATVSLADTGIAVDAFVPRDSPVGQPVTPLLTIAGLTELATALDTYAAGGHPTPARLTVADHVVRLHATGTGLGAVEVLQPDGFGLCAVPLGDWQWRRITGDWNQAADPASIGRHLDMKGNT